MKTITQDSIRAFAFGVASIFLCVSLSAQKPELTTDHTAYHPNEPITASFSGGPGNKKDWVGIYSEGQTPGGPGSTLWNYVDGTRGGNVAFKEGAIRFGSGLTVAGVWDIYFLANDGYTQLAKSSFTVVEPTEPLVRAGKTSYTLGETLSITFTNGPGAAKDWIGVYKEGQTPGQAGVTSTIWNYVDGTKDGRVGKANGTLIFSGGLQAVGKYVAYLLANDGYTVLASEPVTVVASTAGEPPRILSFEPSNLASNLPPSPKFSATLRVGDVKLAPSTVVLKLDGNTVTHQLLDQGTNVVITFASANVMAPLSEHRFSLSFADTTGRKVEQSAQFLVAAYSDIRLPAPLFLETFDGLQEGQFPSGWKGVSYSEVLNEEIDFGNLDSAAYAGWTTVNVDRFKGNFVTYSNPESPQGEKEDYKRVLFNDGLVVVNGKLVSDLAQGKMLFGDSGYRRGRSQVMFLTTSDYDLSGKTDIHLAFNSLWEQNQDSIAVVEFSTDKGSSWKPVAYFLHTVDIKKDDSGKVDVDATLNTEYGDVARYTDELGVELGGTFGAFVAAPIQPSLAPFFQGRLDDSPVDGKRVEVFRLPEADNQKSVRFRLAHAGTDSWYWGVDNFGIYSIPALAAPVLKISRTAGGIEIAWAADARGFTLETSKTLESGSWTPVPLNATASSFIVPTGPSSAYYRLRK